MAREGPGEDIFTRACQAVASYEFSVPDIVEAHFQPDSPLLLRRMLLEIKVLGLRYLCPVIVNLTQIQPGEGSFARFATGAPMSVFGRQRMSSGASSASVTRPVGRPAQSVTTRLASAAHLWRLASSSGLSVA